MANQHLAVPAGMRRISRRFERWRKAHKPRTPFPESLWTSAAETAREHGFYRTAKVLRLESGKLKRAVEAAASNGRPPVRRRAPLEPAVRFQLSQDFLVERARFLLLHTCEHCTHFDPEHPCCVHGYPTFDHREARMAKKKGELVFCKEFELRDALAGGPVVAPPLTLDDPWGIYYTGGTTGLPKGAVLTHGNITWNSVNTVTSWGLHAGHSAPLQLPFFHIGGPNIFMAPLVHVGGTTILCGGFDPEETFDLVEHAGITHYVGVPTMFHMLQAHPRWGTADFSRLELVISGGAPCPLPIMEKFWDRGIDFKMGYGLTEASGNNFWLPPDQVRSKKGAVGYPNFHIDMKTVREDGGDCGAGEPGELLIRCPHVFAGYWNDPAATAA